MRSIWQIGAVLTTLAISCPAITKSLGENTSPRTCEISPIQFEGWHAQQISNSWVRVVVVPQLGGRVMQVSFAGHDFLFVNPKYKGKYIPPSEAAGRWINYGGDKIWPLPEGNEDEHHWVLKSDALDDGEYKFHVLSQGARCAVLLEGPPDATTGLQYAREISMSGDSPEISFHAVMKNIAEHPITWSVQSVSQYDLANHAQPEDFNHNFYAITPVNRHSAYFTGYQVRSGLADDPSFAIDDGLFRLHWLYLENEVWLDSPAGWLAVVDGDSQFAMVERFSFQAQAEYPGNATVIFYKNGVALGVNEHGTPTLSPSSPTDTPYYMEAELNSPMVALQPGESYGFDTTWYPTRATSALSDVNPAGVGIGATTMARSGNGWRISGTFGVFFKGTLTAIFLDASGIELQRMNIGHADPAHLLDLQADVHPPGGTARISLRIVDEQGVERGVLSEVRMKGGAA